MNPHGLLSRFLSCSHAPERAQCGTALLEYASAELGQIDFAYFYPPERLRKRLETEPPDRRHAVGWIALCALVQTLRRGMLGENSTASFAPAEHAAQMARMFGGLSWREFRDAYALSPESTIGSVDAYLKLIVRDMGNPPPTPHGFGWADYLLHAMAGSPNQAAARPTVDFRIVGAPSGSTGLGAILTIRLNAWGCPDLAEPPDPETIARDLLLAPSLTTPVMARWDSSFAAAMRGAMQAAALACLRASPPEAAPGMFWIQPPGSAAGVPGSLPHAVWSIPEVTLYQRKAASFEKLESGRLDSPEIQRILLNHQEQSSASPPDPFGRLGLSGPSAAAACFTAFMDFFRGAQSDAGLMVLGRPAGVDGFRSFKRVDAMPDKLGIIAAAKDCGELTEIDRLFVAGLRPREDGEVLRQAGSPVELVDLNQYLGTTDPTVAQRRPLSRRAEQAAEACESICNEVIRLFPVSTIGSTLTSLLEPRVIVATKPQGAEHCHATTDLGAMDDHSPVAGARDCTGTGGSWPLVATMEDSRLWSNWLPIPSTPAKLLLGRAGSGKTTILLMTAAGAATEAALALRKGRSSKERPIVLPVLISAREQPGDKAFLSLGDILTASWNADTHAALHAMFSTNGVWACEFLFLIDGLDEVEPGTPAMDSLLALVTGSGLRKQCAGASVVLSCRISDSNRWVGRLPEQFHRPNATATLAPFGNRQQRAFLIKRLPDTQAVDIERRLMLDPALRDICSVPLMLDFVASLAENGRLTLLAGENRTTPILCLVIDNILAGGWRRNSAGQMAMNHHRLAAISDFHETAIEWLSGIAFFMLSQEHLSGRANQFDYTLWEMAFQHVAKGLGVRAMEIPTPEVEGNATPASLNPQMRARGFLSFCLWTGLLHFSSTRLADGEKQYSFQHRSLLDYLAAKGLRKSETGLQSLIEEGKIRIPHHRKDMPGMDEISPWQKHPEFELMLHFLFEMLEPAQGRVLYHHLTLQDEDIFGTMTVWRVHAASLVRKIGLSHADTEQLKADVLKMLCQPGFELLEWPAPLLPLRCLGGQIAESVVSELLNLLDGGKSAWRIPFCDVINGLGRCAGLLDRHLAEVVVERLRSGFPSTGQLPADQSRIERKADALWRWAGHLAREQADTISAKLLDMLKSPDHDSFTRRRAAFGLGRAGHILPPARNTAIARQLLDYFNVLTAKDRDSVGNRLLDALGQFAGKLQPEASADIVTSLTRDLVSPENKQLNWIRYGAADALLCWASHPAGTPVCDVVDSLMDSICPDNEESVSVRERVALALDAWMAHLDPACAAQLAEGFAECVSPDGEESLVIANRAVAALGRLPGRVGDANPGRWIEALLNRFNTPAGSEWTPEPKEYLIQEKIADALGRWAGHCDSDQSHEVVSALLARLDAGIPWGLTSRQRSAEALGRWAGHLENGLSLRVVGSLMNHLDPQKEPNREVRERAAEALGWWIGHQSFDGAYQALKSLLNAASPDGEPASEVRCRVALSIGEFAKVGDPVLRRKALRGLLHRLTDVRETSSSVQQALSMALRGWANEADKPGATELSHLRSHFSEIQNPAVLGTFAITLALWATHAPEVEARDIAGFLHQRLEERSRRTPRNAFFATTERYDGRDLACRRLAQALRVISANRGIFIPMIAQEASNSQN